LKVILCVGETLPERETGQTAVVVQKQLQAVVDVLQESDWRCELGQSCCAVLINNIPVVL
jgi:triosephosphate isomerase